jgi:hypothetical protein
MAGAAVCSYADLRGGLKLGFSVRSVASPSLASPSLLTSSDEADHERHCQDEQQRRKQPQRPVKHTAKEGRSEVG